MLFLLHNKNRKQYKVSYKEDARIMKALADENRLAIIELLETEEKCGCVILEKLNITQPTLSYHMKILCDAGIVESCKDGKRTHYYISLDGSKKLQKILGRYTIDEANYKQYKICDYCKND